MVAFVMSIIISVLLVVPFFWLVYVKKVPADYRMSWGVAMFAGMWVFLIFFWVYGIVPHQWLTLADSEWNWRNDKLFVGPGRIFETLLPFNITYLVLRDIVAVIIYNVYLGINILMWSLWQNRGKTKTPKADAGSTAFGRPLIQKASAGS